MSLLTVLAPEQCPPELFGVAWRLITGMEEPTPSATPETHQTE